jgi:hypothetical protein
VHALAEARVVVGEALVVGLHVDQVDVVVPRRLEIPRARSPRRPRWARDAQDGAVDAFWFSGRFMFALRTKNGTARRTTTIAASR